MVKAELYRWYIYSMYISGFQILYSRYNTLTEDVNDTMECVFGVAEDELDNELQYLQW